MRLNIPIIILAAGSANRMRGRDKLLEKIDGIPLLRLQVDKAQAATNADVRVTLPPAPHQLYDVLSKANVTTVPVLDAAEGMNASLRSGIAALPDDAGCAMILLADLPDLTVADLIAVGKAVDLNSDDLIWRGATSNGKAGHPIVFHAKLFPDILKLRGDSGGREVVKSAQGNVHLVALEGDRARADLDTPEAWAAWRERQKTRPSD